MKIKQGNKTKNQKAQIGVGETIIKIIFWIVLFALVSFIVVYLLKRFGVI